ncbi:CsiV family protein [Zhongshania guokunii]|uniref:CsiV family protein n=1 Tax=Zhongshania guokunii TaxID=641783 RepID=A0ABV3U2N0_9GAMM
MSTLHRLRPCVLLAILLWGFSAVAFAQNSDRYHVDMIIYANNDPANMYEEDWPDNIHLRYPRKWVRLQSGDSTSASPHIVDKSDPEFAKVAASLRMSSRFKPLFQASWEQDLKARKKSPAILIQGGKQVGKHYELEGYIRIGVERYLHVDTNLWLISYGDRGENNYYLPHQPMSYNEPEEPAPLIDEAFEASPEYAQFKLQNPDFIANTQPAQEASDFPIEQIVVMKQQRRMRSDELHFIDHPKFGAIIKITKISAPKQ